jgi:AraC-like DNA-binding protein
VRPPDVLFPGAKSFRGYRPIPPLQRFVELIWFVTGRGEWSRERVLPNGAIELIFNLGAPHRVEADSDPTRFERFRNAWIAGFQHRGLVIASERDNDLVGVRFRPAGCWPVLGIPISELTDRVVETCDLHRLGDDSVRDDLHLGASDDARLRIVEAYLLDRVRRGPAPDARVVQGLAELRTHGNQITVEALAGRVGVSRKHLVALFQREVGAAPKAVQRVLRFGAIIRELEQVSTPHWASLAARHGYADQSHLVAEFRAFAGETPKGYWRARSPDPNHMVLDRCASR